MAGEEVKARSTESSSRVLTGPIREAIHSLFGISAGYKTGAAGGQLFLLYGDTPAEAGVHTNDSRADRARSWRRTPESTAERTVLSQIPSLLSPPPEILKALGVIHITFLLNWFLLLLMNASFCAWCRVKSQTIQEYWSLEQRKLYCRTQAKGEQVRLMPSKAPDFPKRIQQVLLKSKVSDGWLLQTYWCRNPLFLYLST